MTQMRMPIPGTRWSFNFNPFEFSPLVQVKREGSRVSLTSRFDGVTHFDIKYIPIKDLPDDVADCFSRDLPAIEQRLGPVEVLASESDTMQEKIVWQSKERLGARFLRRIDNGGLFIAGARPKGDEAELKILLDQFIDSLSESDPRAGLGEKLDVKICGSVDKQTRSGEKKLCVDVLVSTALKDVYIQSLTFQPLQNDKRHTHVFQGRQLPLFSRVVQGQSSNWHSTALPKNAHAIFQFPMIHFPENVDPTNVNLQIFGWDEDGMEVKQAVSMDALAPPVLLQRPVPKHWMMLNGPEHISIHRLAVRVIGNRLFASQRGAVDFKSPDPVIAKNKGYLVNKDYPSYGEPVKAPCDGRVLLCRSDLPDQLPGDRDPANPRGNEICIEIKELTVVVLAHLQAGSLKVQENDLVHKGEVIAAVGNSGNSSEPHLHVHVADSYASNSNGRLAYFVD
jgi:hypothetical protein